MIKEIYYDTPSGNIVLIIKLPHKKLIFDEVGIIIGEEIDIRHYEIPLEIEDIEKLFKKTNDFLNWYHSGDDLE